MHSLIFLDDAQIDFFNVDLPQKCDINKDKIWQNITKPLPGDQPVPSNFLLI